MNEELEQRLRFCGNLPSLPAVALKMVELANNPEAALNDVAQVISMDPALVTKLFRAANSPLYGTGRKVTNLRQVLSLLGLQGTLALALGFSLIATGRDAKKMPLNVDQFWRRSLLTATACRLLGERLSMKNLEELFLAGLLQNIGVLALAILMPEAYGTLLQEATEAQESGEASLDYARLAALEQAQLGDNHATVGAWLLRHWRLPNYLCQAAAGSLDPDRADITESYRALAQCVALAARIADIWVCPHRWQQSPEVADLAQRWFSLDTDYYMELLKSVGAKFPEIAALFQIKSLDAIQIAGILDQAREALEIRAIQRWPERSSNALNRDAPAALPSRLPSTPIAVSARSVQRDSASTPLSGAYAFDALTGLFTRQRLQQRLQQELLTAQEQEWPLSIALLDLDHCRQINESCGRGVGDQVLIALSRLLGGNIRRHDLVARYGDDEFALLLPACGKDPAQRSVERLLMLIRAWEPALPGGQSLRVSVSADLAVCPEIRQVNEDASRRVLALAEQALRQAQASGGDQLCVLLES